MKKISIFLLLGVLISCSTGDDTRKTQKDDIPYVGEVFTGTIRKETSFDTPVDTLVNSIDNSNAKTIDIDVEKFNF